jgi:DNA-binding NarL/FixJ family response regulator
VVGAIVVDRETVGLLHADPGDRQAEPLDLELVGVACEGLGEVFDRAMLRETLQRHRSELQTAVHWISARLGSLAADGQLAPSATGAPDSDAVAALTARELQVLGLMARGQTNAAIAKALVVQEGTVKYHVKNVLRKLGARSRADAVARYARATQQ